MYLFFKLTIWSTAYLKMCLIISLHQNQMQKMHNNYSSPKCNAGAMKQEGRLHHAITINSIFFQYYSPASSPCFAVHNAPQKLKSPILFVFISSLFNIVLERTSKNRTSNTPNIGRSNIEPLEHLVLEIEPNSNI